MAMRSIYIGQIVRPAAAPLIVHMHACLRGVAIIYYYPHPAVLFTIAFETGLNAYTVCFIILGT